ncbi:reverse transcriptase family protein [Bradyrhizobium sp. USDA 4520]
MKIQSVNPRLFPLLTLKHLSVTTGLGYGFLRHVVARKGDYYRQFLMRKKLPGRRAMRTISIPSPKLMQCQQWIVQHILAHVTPHPNSYAYHPKSNPVFAAWRHTKAVWLIKVDIRDFFHAISEHAAYRVFRSLGYAGILSLELARICTMPLKYRVAGQDHAARYGDRAVESYQTRWVGVLPQGAPTSPMLSNLVMKDVDERLTVLARASDMRFIRYADDIVFSCSDGRADASVRLVRNQILEILNEAGFRPNHRKTVIRGPGDRKVVLGMLVDSERPRLAKDFKDQLRMHLHYLSHPDFGPARHAIARKTSISSIYHHVQGLIFWACAVEPTYGARLLKEFQGINWPPVARRDYSATIQQPSG